MWGSRRRGLLPLPNPAEVEFPSRHLQVCTPGLTAADGPALLLRPNAVLSFTVRVISYTRDLPRVTVNQLVAKALALWSREIPLSFRRVLAGTADIMIGFARGGKEGRRKLAAGGPACSREHVPLLRTFLCAPHRM